MTSCTVTRARARATLCNGEHELLRLLEKLLAVPTIGAERGCADPGANVDQLAQYRLLPHDLCVRGHIGRAWRSGSERADITAAVDGVNFPPGFEPLGNCHCIAGLVGFAQFSDRTKDQAMVFAVKVGLGDDVGNLVPGVGGKQEAPENSLFTLNGMRWDLQVLD